jgi:hypothetical protein
MERHIAAIEEVFAARWPRRWLLAARLRKSLRDSTRYIVTGCDFGERREQATMIEMSDEHDTVIYPEWPAADAG